MNFNTSEQYLLNVSDGPILLVLVDEVVRAHLALPHPSYEDITSKGKRAVQSAHSPLY